MRVVHRSTPFGNPPAICIGTTGENSCCSICCFPPLLGLNDTASEMPADFSSSWNFKVSFCCRKNCISPSFSSNFIFRLLISSDIAFSSEAMDSTETGMDLNSSSSGHSSGGVLNLSAEESSFSSTFSDFLGRTGGGVES